MRKARARIRSAAARAGVRRRWAAVPLFALAAACDGRADPPGTGRRCPMASGWPRLHRPVAVTLRGDTLSSEPERIVPLVKHFLEKPDEQLPLATAELGYHPGETR